MCLKKLSANLFMLCISLVVIISGPESSAIESDSPFRSSQVQETNVENRFSLAQVQEDYNLLIQWIHLYHPKLFVNMDEFNELCSTRLSLLHDNMSELEFYRVVSPLVSKLNCGHSLISLSKEHINNIFVKRKVFPLTIRFIDNKTYAYKDYFSTNIPLGSEILNINGKDINIIINVLLDNISSDGQNLTYKYYKINYLFPQLYYYYIDDSEEFIITYKNSKTGKIDKAKVPGVLLPQVFTKNKLPHALPLDDQIIENKYAILKVPSFEFYKGNEIYNFKTYLNDFFKRINENGITNLILDLRYNKGGNPICSTYLLSYLISKQTPYFDPNFAFGEGNLKKDLLQIKPANNCFKGNLFILINGGCFSATGHLCSVLKFQKIGVFIGEETGGSFVCSAYAENPQSHILPNTKLSLDLSSKIYKTAVSGLTFGRGIFPDYNVTPTIDDYLNERDVELDFAMELIENSHKSG